MPVVGTESYGIQQNQILHRPHPVVRHQCN